MKWTYTWLKDYLDTKFSSEEIADKLTNLGLEVESLYTINHPISAKILEIKKHENSEKLKILDVFDGNINRQIVCGAQNVKKGLISALVIPGMKLGDITISSSKIRGIESNGMMCSGKEIGINSDHSGIIELDETKEILGKVVSIFEEKDSIVFEAGITPNRPDYLSVKGIAYDLSASGLGKYKEKNIPYFDYKKSQKKVFIEDSNLCKIYRFAEIDNILLSFNHKTIISRLSSIGITPKFLPIDITNYICFDIGQPMHCYDKDKIKGDIYIRKAKNGEKFVSIFDNEYILSSDDIVIADDEGVLSIAGIIGGKRASVNNLTKNIIFESASFNPIYIRKTSKKLGISTDSSYRYERGIHSSFTKDAINLAINLILEQAGNLISNDFCGIEENTLHQIEYNPNLFEKKTGIILSDNIQFDILKKLGFNIVLLDNKWLINVPAHRLDVIIPENIVSEIIRIYGYNNINVDSNKNIYVSSEYNNKIIGLKKFLAHRGLTEIISYGFSNSQNELLLSDKQNIFIKNPIVKNMDTARNNLLGNLLDIISLNQKKGFFDLNLFELGTVFDGNKPELEHKQLLIIRTGNTSNKHWSKRDRLVDLFDIKSDILSLIEDYNYDIKVNNPPKWAHPFCYGKIIINNIVLAEFGELHPLIAKKWKINTNVMIGLIDNVDFLPSVKKKINFDLYDFQPIRRDFAFIFNKNISILDVENLIKTIDKRIIDISVFDVFSLDEDKQSIAFTIIIQPQSNLTDDDLLNIQNLIISRVEKEFNAKIRDKQIIL